MHKIASQGLRSSLPVPDKLFYKIGEVSKIAGVEPYVLRYWETEFPFLKPRKNKSGQRVYIKKDVETILQIKTMLYQERYTIEGVRKRFGELAPREPQKNTAEKIPIPKEPADVLRFVRARLRDILKTIR
jgi:DNA-binding transcriptional MerR regulator